MANDTPHDTPGKDQLRFEQGLAAELKRQDELRQQRADEKYQKHENEERQRKEAGVYGKKLGQPGPVERMTGERTLSMAQIREAAQLERQARQSIEREVSQGRRPLKDSVIPDRER